METCSSKKQNHENIMPNLKIPTRSSHSNIPCSTRCFESILSVLADDGQNQAILTRAASLAKANMACLTVARVMEGLPHDPHHLAAGMETNVQDLIANEQHKALEEIILPYRKDGIQVRALVLSGKTFPAILHEVESGHYDLVIISAEHRSGLGSQLLGGTVLRMMYKCPCPVLAVRPKRRPVRVIAAVRPEEESELIAGRRDAVNREIINVAISLVEKEKGELHFVRACHAPSEHSLHEYRDHSTSKNLREYIRGVRATHEMQLRTLLAQHELHDLVYKIHLINGETADVIASIADKERVDMIVMGISSRTIVADLLIGHIAEAVFQRVGCSVLTIKSRRMDRDIACG